MNKMVTILGIIISLIGFGMFVGGYIGAATYRGPLDSSENLENYTMYRAMYSAGLIIGIVGIIVVIWGLLSSEKQSIQQPQFQQRRNIMKVNSNSLEVKVERLKQEAYELLPETIKAIKEADDKDKQNGVSWTDRHRLGILLEAIEDSQKGLPDAIGAPWFLAELMVTLGVIRRWRDQSCWKQIEKSLKDPNEFKHTILNLHVAEELIKDGYNVEIVPTGESPSPDLMIHANGETQDLVYIECYQPDALCGKPTDISAKKANRIVETSKAKAERQLDNKTSGLLAICGYNQSSKNIIMLEEAIESGLQKTSLSNLGGIMIVTLGVKVRFEKERMLFNATRRFNFISNPNYSGGVKFVFKIRDDDPKLIDEPLKDLTTEGLMPGDNILVTNIMTTNDVDKKSIKKKKVGKSS